MLSLTAEKLVERAKVTFDYEADDKDELTIKVGDVVDIVSKDEDQEGWWEVGVWVGRWEGLMGGRTV